MSKFSDLKEECYEANLLLNRAGLVGLNFGSVSVSDPDNAVFAIKSSGSSFDSLSRKDIVVLSVENGTILEGESKPASNMLTHLYLYEAFTVFTEIRSIVQFHSRYATSFAQAGLSIPCLGTIHAHYFNGSIPVTREMTIYEVQENYEWEIGKVIMEKMKDIDPLQMQAVLVQNYGPVVWGTSGVKAINNAKALELIAELALNTYRLSPNLSSIQPYLRQKHFYDAHGIKRHFHR